MYDSNQIPNALRQLCRYRATRYDTGHYNGRKTTPTAVAFRRRTTELHGGKPRSDVPNGKSRWSAPARWGRGRLRVVMGDGRVPRLVLHALHRPHDLDVHRRHLLVLRRDQALLVAHRVARLRDVVAVDAAQHTPDGIERDRTGSNGIERDRTGSNGIERYRTVSNGIVSRVSSKIEFFLLDVSQFTSYV